MTCRWCGEVHRDYYECGCGKHRRDRLGEFPVWDGTDRHGVFYCEDKKHQPIYKEQRNETRT